MKLVLAPMAKVNVAATQKVKKKASAAKVNVVAVNFLI